MKQIGTALEWHKTKPEAYIAHPELQKGVSLRIVEYSKKGIVATYEAFSHNGPPIIWFGSKCPYMITGLVSYKVHVLYGANGGVTALSDELAKDLNWFEVDPIDYHERSFK